MPLCDCCILNCICIVVGPVVALFYLEFVEENFHLGFSLKIFWLYDPDFQENVLIFDSL